MPRIETSRFTMEFSEDWVLEDGPRATLVTADGACAIASSLTIEGSGGKAAIEGLQEVVLEAMTGAANEPGVEWTEDLILEEGPDGGDWFELRARTTDGSTIFWQFARVNAYGSVLVTVEAPAELAYRVTEVRDVVFAGQPIVPEPAKKSWFATWFG